MNFEQNVTAASAALLELSTRIDNLEIQLVRLDEHRDETEMLTTIVTRLFEAKGLSEELLHQHIPAVAVEEPAVATALRITYQELMRRYWGVRDDLEVMTKVRGRRAARPTAANGTVVDIATRRRAAGR